MIDFQKTGAIIVSAIVTVGFASSVVLWIIKPPSVSSDVLTGMMLVLSTNFTTVVSYWLGSSAGSKAKDESIAKMSAQ